MLISITSAPWSWHRRGHTHAELGRERCEERSAAGVEQPVRDAERADLFAQPVRAERVSKLLAEALGGSWGKPSPLDVVDGLDEPLLTVCERRGHVLTPVERHPAPGFPEGDIRSLIEPPAAALAGHLSGSILPIAGGMEGRWLHRPENT